MKKIVALFVLAFALLAGVGAYYVFNYVGLNNPSYARYPVRGIDVSSEQEALDASDFSGQGNQFAFIRASEGSKQDEMFEQNVSIAKEAGLVVGAYHTFDYDVPGVVQANKFIACVPKDDEMLPPVIDIDLYGVYAEKPTYAQRVQQTLDAMIGRLESHYGKTPVLRATQRTYELYIMDHYRAYPLWIRSVLRAPNLPNNAGWTFWQYSSENENAYHMNTFSGNIKQFEAFVAKKIVPTATEEDWDMIEDDEEE
ncbi:hypothetical protein LJC33_08945 [Eubacteriales bacterium OttesenSCG-928-N13]|nr:hypothetical protein [Eubacteriales bacterium OttesenSCG-928-N13]